MIQRKNPSTLVEGSSILKSLLFSYKETNINFSKITSVSFTRGLIFGKIELTISEDKTVIVEQIQKRYAERFADVLNTELNKYLNKSLKSLEVPLNEFKEYHIDVTKEIRKFKELYDEGILTEDEFIKKKEELLNIKY